MTKDPRVEVGFTRYYYNELYRLSRFGIKHNVRHTLFGKIGIRSGVHSRKTGIRSGGQV